MYKRISLKLLVSILSLLLVVSVTAQKKEISAAVTYVASGNVYVNAGRSQGVGDSATAVVVRNGLTVTTLRLDAASSKSSSWLADSGLQSIRVGDLVRASVADLDTGGPAVDSTKRFASPTILTSSYQRTDITAEHPWLELQGRVGAQVFAMGFDDPALDLLQAGLTVSFRARARDLPLRLDVYGHLRDVSRGSAAPLSARSADASRLYRWTLEYDDRTNVVTAGRMALPQAPTIGILDGLTYSRRMGGWTAGAGIGLQPHHDLLGTDPDRRKMLVFASYHPTDWPSASVSAAYAKTWFRGASEREAINSTAGASVTDRLMLWTSVDLDLRVTEQGVHRLHPSLSLLLFSVTWRVTDALSLTGGADASRSVMPFSFARLIPDSMTDRTLRSGMTLSGSWAIRRGLSMTASLTPRMADGAFNGEYAGSTTVSSYDLFGSGVGLRVQGLLTQSVVTEGQGYGATAMFQAVSVDWSARFQQIRYRLKRSGATSFGTTLGLDAMVTVFRPFSLLVSVDLVRGFGSTSRSLFTELSYRF